MKSRMRTSQQQRATAARLLVAGMLAGVLALAGCIPTVETFWSPDSEAVAYLADGELRLYDVATGQSRPLDTGTAQVICAAWSPDGRSVAFYAASPGEEPVVSLRVMALDSRRVTTLVDDVWPPSDAASDAEGDVDEPQEEGGATNEDDDLDGLEYVGKITWRPDGKALACVGGFEDRCTILIVEYPSGRAKPIFEQPGWAALAPAWSPDGEKLAYVRLAPDSCEEASEGAGTEAIEQAGSLWLLDRRSGVSQNVCDLRGEALAGMVARLRWSPDSRRIGFFACGEDDHSVSGFLVDALPGATPREALTGLTSASDWSPTLSAVTYVGADDEQKIQVMVRDLEGDEPRVLATIGEVLLLYRNTDRDVTVLFGIPPPAEELESATSSDEPPPWCSAPQFSPDGRKVALVVGKTPERKRVLVFPVE